MMLIASLNLTATTTPLFIAILGFSAPLLAVIVSYFLNRKRLQDIHVLVDGSFQDAKERVARLEKLIDEMRRDAKRTAVGVKKDKAVALAKKK